MCVPDCRDSVGCTLGSCRETFSTRGRSNWSSALGWSWLPPHITHTLFTSHGLVEEHTRCTWGRTRSQCPYLNVGHFIMQDRVVITHQTEMTYLMALFSMFHYSVMIRYYTSSPHTSHEHTLLLRFCSMPGWMRRRLLQLTRGRTRAAEQPLSGARGSFTSDISAMLQEITKITAPLLL